MNKMRHIEINIGKACNNKCIFCMSSKPQLDDIKFVNLLTIKEKISYYSDNGYKSIGFLGGDISIHPNLIEIIAFCKQKGFININIVSNGMRFKDYQLCYSLVNSGLTRINFSIHSHLNNIEDYLTGVPGGLKNKLEAINNFQQLYKKGLLRDDLSINIVVNRKNYETIIETVLFFSLKKNIKDIRINFVWLSRDVKENWENLKLSYTQFFSYLKKLVYVAIKYKIRLTFDTIPICIFYNIDPVNYKSIIKRFVGEDLDNIVEIDHINNNDNFNWKERKKDTLKTQFESCNKCIFKNTCQGVRNEYSQLYGGDEFTPIFNL